MLYARAGPTNATATAYALQKAHVYAVRVFEGAIAQSFAPVVTVILVLGTGSAVRQQRARANGDMLAAVVSWSARELMACHVDVRLPTTRVR